MSAGSKALPRWRTLCTRSQHPRASGRFSWALPRGGRRPLRTRDQPPAMGVPWTSHPPSPWTWRAHAPRPWLPHVCASPPIDRRVSLRSSSVSPRAPGALGALRKGALVVGGTWARRWRPPGPPRCRIPKTAGRSCAPGPRPPGPGRRRRRPWRPFCLPTSGWPGGPARPAAAAPAGEGASVTGGFLVRSLDAMAAAAVAQPAAARRALGPWAPAFQAGPGHPAPTPSLAAVKAVPRTWGPCEQQSVGPRPDTPSVDGRGPCQPRRACSLAWTHKRDTRCPLATATHGRAESSPWQI